MDNNQSVGYYKFRYKFGSGKRVLVRGDYVLSKKDKRKIYDECMNDPILRSGYEKIKKMSNN